MISNPKEEIMNLNELSSGDLRIEPYWIKDPVI